MLRILGITFREPATRKYLNALVEDDLPLKYPPSGIRVSA